MLYMVMLGGKHPKAKIEVHDVVFAVGETLSDTYPQLVQNWFGDAKQVHIDAWMSIAGVEQYAVHLSQTPSQSGPKLYFVNLGGYLSHAFGEDHRYLLVVADNEAQAKAKAKAQAPALWHKPHRDQLADVDDCLELDSVDGLYVHLREEPHQGLHYQNDYIPL